jgi:organic radical activating enzyme
MRKILGGKRMIHIAGTEYNLHRSCLEIYVCGCKAPHCDGCHNVGLWGFIEHDNTEKYKKIISDKFKSGMINEFFILGGEPLDQNLDELENFIIFLKKFDVNIWLWTRYTEYLHLNFLDLLDYIKIGKYDKRLNSYIDNKHDIELASSNQKIIKLRG